MPSVSDTHRGPVQAACSPTQLDRVKVAVKVQIKVKVEVLA
jgi:hypothetical protein